MPHPMPVPIFTNRKSSTEWATPPCRSPIAMMLTSLSTTAGHPCSRVNSSRTGNRSQPGVDHLDVDRAGAEVARGEPEVGAQLDQRRAAPAAGGGEPGLRHVAERDQPFQLGQQA